MRQGCTLVSCGLLLVSTCALAYELETHADLSQAALQASVLSQPSVGVLTDLGLPESINVTNQFPDSNGARRSISVLFQNGARFEDSGFRPRNHFYNPLNNAPLTIPGIPLLNFTSPGWALEESGQITGVLGIGSQEFSFADARRYLLNALTSSGESDRQKNFGLTFQALGQDVHHIQDMAQPQHVRNDPHWDQLSLLGLNPLFNPSLYEKWTDGDKVRGTLQSLFSGYPSTYSAADRTTFNIARNFWHTPTADPVRVGKGLADFTNRNFVSAGTNFDKPGLFPSPDFNNVTSTSSDIQQLCAGAQPACTGLTTGLTGTMFFFGNTVVDLYTGGIGENNPRASTLSLFDADLQKAGKPFIFTLNRFNFTAAHSFLIPRAVGYSAGLINYFFRGKIDYVPAPATPGGFLIKNLGPEDMSGTFALYYDTQDGTRKAVLDRQNNPVAWQTPTSTPLAANTGQMPVTPNFDQPADAKTVNTYMLVFTGQMGAEAPAADSVGAVVAKAVQNPYAGVLYVAGTTAAGQVQFFKVDKNGVSGLQPNELNPLEQISTGFWNPERPYHFKQAVLSTDPSGVVVHKTVAVSFTQSVSPQTDLSYVLDPGTGSLRPVAGLQWIAQSPDPAVGTFQFKLVVGQQPFLSYTRTFVNAGNTSQATGAFLLPAIPAGTSFSYDFFGRGTMFVSPDGTTFYPRGSTTVLPQGGLRITLGSVPSATIFNYSGTSSSAVTSNPASETVTKTGVCLVDYIAANPAGGQTPFFPATAQADRNTIARLSTDTTQTQSSVITEDFDYIRNQPLTYEMRITSRVFQSSVTDTCTVAALDFSDPTRTPKVKVNVQFNSQVQFISRTERAAILPGGQIQSVTDFSGVVPAQTFISCGQASDGSLFVAGLPRIPDAGIVDFVSLNYSYEGFAPCPQQLGTKLSGVDTGTPKQTIYRALTSDSRNAIYVDASANPGILKFDGQPLPIANGQRLIIDVSPLGEVFVAASDLSVVIHKPNGGNMPVLDRDMVPSGIVGLLAAVWM